MGYVTDIVFITPSFSYKHKATERFQELFRLYYTRYKDPYIPSPVEDNGTKASMIVVFHLGVNYADFELLEALRNEPWPAGSVLYIDGENDDSPVIKTW